MMASDDLEFESIEEKKSGSPVKKPKRRKRASQSTKPNGVMENGNDSLTDLRPPQSPRYSESKKPTDSALETSIHSHTSDRSSKKRNEKLDRALTPIENSGSSEKNHVEVTAITDEDDYEPERGRTNYRTDYTTTDRSTTGAMAQSSTSADNDAIEIHEFTVADVDSYLEIYFDTLDNRLRHFIGENESLEEFRKTMRTRIVTDENALEYRNVLLGKINGEVVAAVRLSFTGDIATISNDNLLPQVKSCFAPIRRWMLRNANYNPTNIEECYIEMIGVKKDFRNNGIGTAMLECVEQFARQEGALYLAVHTNDDRLRLYFEQFGFAVDHTDNSAVWKWAVERQSTSKMCKLIPSNDGNNDYSMNNSDSYINESLAESEMEYNH